MGARRIFVSIFQVHILAIDKPIMLPEKGLGKRKKKRTFL